MTRQRKLSKLEQMLERLASSPAGGFFFARIAPIIDRPLMRLTKGKVSTAVGQPVGLITMIGAKTGQPRQVPLLCTPDGDNWLIVASNGGNQKNPAWLYNLRTNPEITMLINGQEDKYMVHETEGAERTHAWATVVDFYAGYTEYEKRSGREIPVFSLKRLKP